MNPNDFKVGDYVRIRNEHQYSYIEPYEGIVVDTTHKHHGRVEVKFSDMESGSCTMSTSILEFDTSYKCKPIDQVDQDYKSTEFNDAYYEGLAALLRENGYIVEKL